jgi:O-methyltransferase
MIKRYTQKILKHFGYRLHNIQNDEINQFNFEDRKILDLYSKYTMTSDYRMSMLLKSFNHIRENNIDGDFVECGVWKGGNLMILNHLNNFYKTARKIYGFDTYQGMSEPTSHDIKVDGTVATIKFDKLKDGENFSNWDNCSIDEVKNNFIKNRLNPNEINFIKGKVENTLLDGNNLPKKISILRLDTDFYESTKIELEILYPLLSKNGVLIIDDYGCWEGARKAVDEYFSNSKIWLNFIDHSSRVIIKQ